MRSAAALRGLLLVCLARGHVLVDAVPRQETMPAAGARHRAAALWGQGGGAPRAPALRLRGGERERVREGQVSKKGATGRGDSKKKDTRKRRGTGASDEHGGPAAAAVLPPSAEAARSAADEHAGSGGDSGAAEGHEDDGKAHEGTAGTGAAGPSLFFGRDFDGDFPNRERVDELYREAAVFMDEHAQGSSELEESSGDGQGNNPFEVCVTLWCAGPCA